MQPVEGDKTKDSPKFNPLPVIKFIVSGCSSDIRHSSPLVKGQWIVLNRKCNNQTSSRVGSRNFRSKTPPYNLRTRYWTQAWRLISQTIFLSWDQQDLTSGVTLAPLQLSTHWIQPLVDFLGPIILSQPIGSIRNFFGLEPYETPTKHFGWQCKVAPDQNDPNCTDKSIREMPALSILDIF